MLSAEYLAGLFDGEGYVGVVYNKVHDAWGLRLSVTNNHKGICESLRNQFGGALVPPRHYGPVEGKGAWTWAAYSSRAKEFLRVIQPFTIIKKPQVDLALTYPLGQLGRPVTDDMRRLRHTIMERLQEMKQGVWTQATAEDLLHRRALAEREDVKMAAALYKQGYSIDAIAELTGAKQPTISYWMRSLGISRSRREAQKQAGTRRWAKHQRQPELQRAKAMYEGGTPVSEIARVLGRKPATVNYWLRRMGLTRSLSAAQALRRQRERDSGAALQYRRYDMAWAKNDLGSLADTT